MEKQLQNKKNKTQEQWYYYVVYEVKSQGSTGLGGNTWI